MISLAILVPICTIAIVGLSSALVVPPLPVLKNSYVALRHGQSEANIEGIISSDPAIGTTKHGLTISGRVQARKAATSLLEVCGRETVESLIFVSSDFVRARETAAECRDAIQRIISFETEPLGLDPWVCSDVIIDLGLRERFFGALDGCPLSRYNEVWPRDLEDANSEYKGVETVTNVAKRVRELIMRLEGQFEGKTIVMSSHADTLQIMQCYVAMADIRAFSQFRFTNGEIRLLRQDPSSLPSPRPLSFQ